jgi:hypothetical protein
MGNNSPGLKTKPNTSRFNSSVTEIKIPKKQKNILAKLSTSINSQQDSDIDDLVHILGETKKQRK